MWEYGPNMPYQGLLGPFSVPITGKAACHSRFIAQEPFVRHSLPSIKEAGSRAKFSEVLLQGALFIMKKEGRRRMGGLSRATAEGKEWRGRRLPNGRGLGPWRRGRRR